MLAMLDHPSMRPTCGRGRTTRSRRRASRRDKTWSSFPRGDRRGGAQIQHVAFDLHDARLGLAEPVRKQRHEHGVGEGLLHLVGVKRSGIGDVAQGPLLDLLISAAVPIAGRKLPTARAHQLRGHVAVGRVHDDALGLLSHRVEGCRSIDGLLDVGHELPGSDQALTQRLHDDRLPYCADCMSLSIGSIWPEIDFAASEARNTASAAMSFGSTSRLIDCTAIASFRISSTGLCVACARPSNTFSIRAPPTAPGRMALARTPCAPSSMESVLVNPIKPHFAVQYGLRLA